MTAPLQDPTTALLGALRAWAGEKVEMRVEKVTSRRWASVTFAGARHELRLHFSGEAAESVAERAAGCLTAAEFHLRGHILADIAVAAQERAEDGIRLLVEALTVEDA